MEKGIFTLEQERILSEKLDNVVKVKGVLELIDGYVFKALLTFLDDTYVDKIKEDLKVMLASLADAVLNEDIDEAEIIASEIINTMVDIPGLDENAEGLLFKGIIEILVAAVIKWIESKKEQPVQLKVWRL